MQKTMMIAAFLSFLLFMAAGYFVAVQMMERDLEWEKAERQAEAVLKDTMRINADTELIYQYFYTEDKITKEQTEPSPQFLQGLNLEELQSIYNGWQIISFSEEKVILRSQINGRSDEAYILGENDGYLAVFYEDAEKNIHLQERTDMPLSALSADDAMQIRAGLRILGEENLAKVLSDYLS